MARNKNIHLYDINSVFTEFDKYLEDSKFNRMVELSNSETLNDDYMNLVAQFRDKFSIDELTTEREDFIKIVKEKYALIYNKQKNANSSSDKLFDTFP